MSQALASKKKPGSSVPFLTFLLDQDNILIMKWHGFVKGEFIKEGHEDCLKYIQEHKITDLVEDVVDFSGPFAEVNDWFINYWVPKALQRGLKKAAVLMNKDVFTGLSVEALKENPEFKKLGLGYQIFGDMNDVIYWLREKEIVKS